MERVSNPLVSIIIPVYNVEKYLDRCVESIVKQTYENIEILLVDDGSPDNSPKMCDEWAKKDNRVKPIHKKNGGVSSARNMGIEKANGEYISFVDSDDWIVPTYIEEMLNELINKNADYITCGYKRVYNDEHIDLFNSDGEIKVIDSDEYLKNVMNVLPGYGFTHMKLIKKELIGDVRFDESIKVAEDALFNAMLCKNIKNVVVYNKPLYNYFFNENSVVRKFDMNYANKYLDAMNAMYNYVGSNNKDIYNYIAFHVLLICVNYCYHPQMDNNKKSLKEVCNIPLFKDAIKKSSYGSFSLTKKVTLFTVKWKLYFLTGMICKFRQRQFKK